MDTLLLLLRTAFRSFRKSGRQEERQIKEYVTPVSESTSRVDRRVILSWGDYCLWKERRQVDLVLNLHDGFATYRTGLSHLGKVDDWPSRLISLTVQCYGENRMGRAASTLHIYWNLISLHYCTQLPKMYPKLLFVLFWSFICLIVFRMTIVKHSGIVGPFFTEKNKSGSAPVTGLQSRGARCTPSWCWHDGVNHLPWRLGKHIMFDAGEQDRSVPFPDFWTICLLLTFQVR